MAIVVLLVAAPLAAFYISLFVGRFGVSPGHVMLILGARVLPFVSAPSTRDTQIAEDALHMVGLYDVRNKPYTQLSGGERQLVLIARTLAQQPAVILLDEPTSHLDFHNEALVLAIVARLAAQGLAVVMTTHRPDHALVYASRVALMRDGHFLAVGVPTEVMSEAQLRELYGIEVRILTGVDAQTGSQMRACIPVLESVQQELELTSASELTLRSRG